jgi:phage tail P2-like protein
MSTAKIQASSTPIDNLMPSNSTSLERDLSALSRTLESIPINIETLTSIPQCPKHLLPYLAQDVSLDTWYVSEQQLTTEALRTALALNADVHRTKGSVSSIINAINIIGFDYKLIEWWQESSQYKTPFHFEIRMNAQDKQGKPYTAIVDNRLKSLINKIKPVRTRFTVDLHSELKQSVQLAAKSRCSQQATFNFYIDLTPIKALFFSTIHLGREIRKRQTKHLNLQTILPVS